MKTLILSDIHANLTAFEAVLSDAGSFDRVWCLGDVVGYGPDPNECVALLRQQPGLRCIMGNHDAALMGYIDIHTFNEQAARAVAIQSEMLNPESRDFLELLDIVIEEGDITFAHGSPRELRDTATHPTVRAFLAREEVRPADAPAAKPVPSRP